MGKGKRIREYRRNPVHIQNERPRKASHFGFLLPNDPYNRDLVRMVTGKSPDRFINPDGMLDSEFRQKNSGDCEAGKLQSPPIL